MAALLLYKAVNDNNQKKVSNSNVSYHDDDYGPPETPEQIKQRRQGAEQVKRLIAENKEKATHLFEIIRLCIDKLMTPYGEKLTEYYYGSASYDTLTVVCKTRWSMFWIELRSDSDHADVEFIEQTWCDTKKRFRGSTKPDFDINDLVTEEDGVSFATFMDPILKRIAVASNIWCLLSRYVQCPTWSATTPYTMKLSITTPGTWYGTNKQDFLITILKNGLATVEYPKLPLRTTTTVSELIDYIKCTAKLQDLQCSLERLDATIDRLLGTQFIF